ncbi:4Fe-4S binding protein [Clostridium sediminicola]|uniref:ATP-binding protein n=1 Tax=Clostridium sediminicola TaxID=3114879 RepID=UPI0031F2218A
MKRKIISIDESKCNGCGLCAKACHEGAIEMINGKAKLVKDDYCDGLGDCLPSCPTDAIKIIEREAAAFDEEAVKIRMEEMKNIKQKEDDNSEDCGCGCPGETLQVFNRDVKEVKPNIAVAEKKKGTGSNSELRQWPVQLNLVNTRAPYFENADLLIAADCTAYAYGDFHKDFIKNHVTVIGCPKLDDNKHYEDKLMELLQLNDINSITVVRMSVPCCSGIVSSVKNAMLRSGKIVNYKEVTINSDGTIK